MMNRKTFKKIAMVCILLILLFVPVFGGEHLYMLITPRVTGTGIGPAFFGEIKYPYVIDKEFVINDETGTYVVLIKSKNGYWGTSYYTELAYIEIITESDTQVAIEFKNHNYAKGDLLLNEFQTDYYLNGNFYLDMD